MGGPYRNDGYNNVYAGEDVQKSMLRIDVKYNDERRMIVMTSSVMMMILDGDNS